MYNKLKVWNEFRNSKNLNFFINNGGIVSCIKEMLEIRDKSSFVYTYPDGWNKYNGQDVFYITIWKVFMIYVLEIKNY